MGRKAQYGSLDIFIEQVVAAKLMIDGLKVDYDSPSLGRVKAGWSGPLQVAGEVIPTSDYKRYDNPSCQAEFAADVVDIAYGGESLRLTRQLADTN